MDFEDESFLQLQKAMKEIKMWRQREVDNMIFVDSREEKWFTDALLKRPAGLEDIDQYAEFMLKGYRDTREKND